MRRSGDISVSNQGKITLRKGLLLDDVHAFGHVLRNYVILDGFENKKLKNERTRVALVFVTKGCL